MNVLHYKGNFRRGLFHCSLPIIHLKCIFKIIEGQENHLLSLWKEKHLKNILVGIFRMEMAGLKFGYSGNLLELEK